VKNVKRKKRKKEKNSSSSVERLPYMGRVMGFYWA
jgi:hypothetical protein